MTATDWIWYALGWFSAGTVYCVVMACKLGKEACAEDAEDDYDWPGENGMRRRM